MKKHGIHERKMCEHYKEALNTAIGLQMHV